MKNTIHMILWPRISGSHLLFAIRQEGHTFAVVEHAMATPDTYPAVHVPLSDLKTCLESHVESGCKLHTDMKRPGMFLLIAPGKTIADGIEAIMFFENAIKMP